MKIVRAGSDPVCFALFAKSFAYFAVRLTGQSKTAKIAKRDAKFRKSRPTKLAIVCPILRAVLENARHSLYFPINCYFWK